MAGAFHKLYVVEAEDSRVVVVTLNYTRFMYDSSGIFIPHFIAYTYCIILYICRDGISKLLKMPKNRFQGMILPAFVAWRTGTTTLFLLVPRPIDYYKIPEQRRYFKSFNLSL